MRLILLTILFCLPLAAQTVIEKQVTIQIKTEGVPALRDWLARTHKEAVDTNRDGTLQGAEILAWFEAEVIQKEIDRIMDHAARDVLQLAQSEDQATADDALTKLPQTLRDALAAKRSAETTFEAEIEKLK